MIYMYSACAQDGPHGMERNEAAARHSWERQHAWLLLRFFPFPVGHPEQEHCTCTSDDKPTIQCYNFHEQAQYIFELEGTFSSERVRGGKRTNIDALKRFAGRREEQTASKSSIPLLPLPSFLSSTIYRVGQQQFGRIRTHPALC